MKKFAVFDLDGTLIRWQLYHSIVDKLNQMGFINPDDFAKIGEVSQRAQQTVVFVPRPSEEEDLLGVSAMMGAIPKHGDDKPRIRKPAKKKRLKARRKVTPRRRKPKVVKLP